MQEVKEAKLNKNKNKMSAIYCWLKTDQGKEVTRTANKRLDFSVNVGSKDSSKEIIELKVLKTLKGFEVVVNGEITKTINSD